MIAKRKMRRISTWRNSSRKTASSGPKNAPRLSPTPSSPNALPRCSSSAEDAISASRGAERVPGPGNARPTLLANQ
jgi:hypothetical protein